MTFGLFRRGAGLLAVSLTAAAAVAQSGAGQPAGPALNIPQNVNFVGGSAEANVARATAIVNDEIITRTDVEQRLALLTGGQRDQIPAEELDRARAQVFRTLVDETLQIQAAREQEITIERREIDQEFTEIAQRNGQTAAGFNAFLTSIGSSERSLKRQITGELSWRRLLQRMSRVSVTDEEVRRTYERMNATRGSTEYRVAEIYLRATPENAQQVRGRMVQLIELVRGGAPFSAVARQYTEASTGAVGGDLGWIRSEQLPPELGAVVQQMPVGAISDPIQLAEGFSVIALMDSRQVLSANPRDAVLNLMQMSITLPPGTTEAQARQRAGDLGRATQAMGGCGRAAETAQQLGAELVSNDSTRVRDLPPQIQQTVLGMSLGQATEPFGSLQRISVLVLCGRDDPEQPRAPTLASIEDALGQQRMQLQAQRYIRDLRRDAIIEYR